MSNFACGGEFCFSPVTTGSRLLQLLQKALQVMTFLAVFFLKGITGEIN